ncbi:excinuclease ABC subunit A [Gallaecimonas xiamenensis]|uniref:Excinuclease ATPase subunit n=1 Tax=Gallaecimonas xiamenensis 3-C-1 TaxID=745411 RepID=K2ITZ3_9GAMM|nr:excinuclease ABC subunit A [Gallaecimonas xiamenensis]EKE73706.1 excinuclease ATPase subunit [Gallaecimonas xiamenensis 3-C-1]
MFKKTLLGGLVLTLLSAPVLARDTIADYQVSEALAHPKAKEVLGDNIQFFFGKQAHGKVEKTLGESRTNQKTNAFAKSDKEACQWVFLSAMKALKNQAEANGANAVINIRSNYRNNLTSSDSTFKCGAGAIIAGVALVGDLAVIKK